MSDHNAPLSGRTVPVVIVGAGPTGVGAATLLAGYGVECLVLDRWEGVYPRPRAVHMDDEVRRILAALGVDEEFAAVSRPARGLRLVGRDRRVLAEFHRDRENGEHGYPQANMFDQPVLEEILRRNMKRHDAVAFRGDVEVTGVAREGSDRVRVDFTDRSTGRGEHVRARYVLGCDGANSLVRACIGAMMRDLGFEQRWLVADVETEADLGQWDGVHQVCDSVRAATYMRVGRTRYRWEFRLLPGENAECYSDPDTLRPLIAPWVHGVADEELELVRVAEYTFRAQIADRWRDGRVFLLGDAAHLTPPFIGQGMGAGLRDAVNLVWKLAGVVRGELPASVLDTYQAEREPHARSMIRMARLVGIAMTGGGDLGDAVRGALAPHLHRMPGVEDMAVHGRTPALGGPAPAVRRVGDTLSGRLCPNPPMADGRRLDDHVRGRFAVITTTALSALQRTEVEARGAVVVTAAPGTELHGWLCRGGARAALVRPDRAVMRTERDPYLLCASVPAFAVGLAGFEARN